MKTTTLNKIRSHNPCKQSYVLLLKSLNKTKPDDEPLSFRHILDTIGIHDAVWCLRTLQYKEFCLFSADVAETVLHIFEERYADDKRPRRAVEAIRKFHSGEITEDQLAKSAANANVASCAAHTAYAYAASSAAYSAASSAASSAACSAVSSATPAVNPTTASYAATAACYAKAKVKKWKEIETLFLKHFC